MHLFDVRLKFARDLIGHWLDLRLGQRVPLEADLDPRALLRCLDHIAFIDLTQASKLTIEQPGLVMRRRFGCDIRYMNWGELVPATLGDPGQRARERIRRIPCAFYHKFTVALDGADTVTAETLLLPLRRRNAVLPHVVIGMTRDIGKDGAGTPSGWLTPSADVVQYFMELVDISDVGCG